MRAAYDADGEHRTLSSRYPDDVEKFDAANSPEEFGRPVPRRFATFQFRPH
jgi:hypothetical protein